MPLVMSEAATLDAPDPLNSPAFRARRTQNWIVLGLLYAFFYMTRYNFAANMDGLAKLFGWNNTQLGIFETVLPLVYGLSVVINGPISDRVGGKKAFLFGAVGVTIMNILYGLGVMLVEKPAVVTGKGHALQVVEPAVMRFGLTGGTVLAMLATVWGINAYFQSFGALSIVKVNAQWFHVRERGVFSGIFGVLIRFGLILAFSGAPLLASTLGLAYAFLLPGIVVGVLFVVNYFMMENSPADAGFAGIDMGDGAGADAKDDKPPTLGYVLSKVFASRAAWIIAFGSMMLGLVRRSTVDSWFGKYFANNYVPAGVDKSTFAAYQAAAWGIALLGIAGGFAFGAASDRVFQARRAPVVTVGFVGMGATLALFGLMDRVAPGPWEAAIFVSVLSFFVNGSHGMIGGAASMDFGGRKAAATAAGLFDGMQYLASSIVGLGMGWVLDHWGWKAWQWVPIPFAVIGCALMATLWNAKPKQGGGH
jgi:OPA family glycerol-3-phosphate transporter-like MFS transporter